MTLVVTKRPTHQDGTKYEFNCCHTPDVRWRSAVKKKAVCESCGYNWTDSL